MYSSNILHFYVRTIHLICGICQTTEPRKDFIGALSESPICHKTVVVTIKFEKIELPERQRKNDRFSSSDRNAQATDRVRSYHDKKTLREYRK